MFAYSSICFGRMSAFVETPFASLNRSRWISRAAAIVFLADSVSPLLFFTLVRIDSGGISGTDTQRSILAATCPDIFLRYFSTMCGIQSQREEPQKPQGHGFKAATSMKFAGNIAEPFERDMDTTRSSSGSPSAFTTSR